MSGEEACKVSAFDQGVEVVLVSLILVSGAGGKVAFNRHINMGAVEVPVHAVCCTDTASFT